ncbi:hypothetical protein [Staphylococcus warneri]|uniref:hypothetical protein n=1 Tax=Staphylococcus warneri TaxID=1292 RepID=UPI001F33E9CA|nr:hypothetical protein [Staphylococcus warneri]MCE5000501.1 hypothetical protein [Staphylococcus warneri]
MDFKQVFLLNGQPYLAFKDNDGEYQYPNDEWTDVPPPAGGYQPMHFDGNKWICATREEWLKNQSPIHVEPDSQTELIAQLLMNDLEHNMRIEMLEQGLANVLNELLELKGDVQDVRNT